MLADARYEECFATSFNQLQQELRAHQSLHKGLVPRFLALSPQQQTRVEPQDEQPLRAKK